MEFYGVLQIDRDVYHIMTCRSFLFNLQPILFFLVCV